MGISYNPSIATSGLVFYYDAGNTKKSWKGAPTTNLVTNPSFTSGLWPNTWNATSGTTVLTGSTYNGGAIVRSTLNFATSHGSQTANDATITSSTVVSISLDVRASRSMNLNYTYLMRSGGVGNLVFPSQAITTDWTRVSMTVTNTITTSCGVLVGIVQSAGDWFEYTNVQLEAQPFATPFVNGTRSNTQSLVDLTNNGTITSTSLTYTNNGAFSFDGSSTYVDVVSSGLTSGMTAYTIMFWARRDAENRMPVATRTGSTFYWYGDNSWKYQHSGVNGEYYYSKPTNIPLGTWGHYCVVYNGANVSIYRQGIFQGLQATTGTADWSVGLRIGYWAAGDTSRYWQGSIDAVSMYNRALSASEVEQNFNAARGRYGI